MKSLSVAVTGSSGFLGSYLVKALFKEGHKVKRFQRKNGDVTFVLGQDLPQTAFKDVDVLIHTAYDFNPLKKSDVFEKNVDGSIKLFETAKRSGVKNIIFISSISAFEGCRSEYGQGKLEVEKYVESIGGVSVRPGLICGDDSFGMYGRLKKISKLPVLPIFDLGAQPLYLININDLCDKILTVVSEFRNYSRKTLTVASKDGIKFKDLLRELDGRKPKLLIPFPSFIALFIFRFFEQFNIVLGFKSDSLVGLIESK